MSTIKLLSGGGQGGKRGFSFGSSSNTDVIPDVMGFFSPIAVSYIWKKCAMSRNGRYQVAGFKNGQLFYSSNDGYTWTMVVGIIQNWMSICCSSSGDYFFAAGKDGEVYRSIDFGVSWVQIYTDAETNLYDLSCSADGKYVLLAKGTAGLQNQVSTDYGITWVNSFPSTFNMKCAVSGTGQTMYLCRQGGVIYKNVNYGAAASWDAGTIIDAGATICDSIRCSSNAQYLMTWFSARWLYTSSDGGATWKDQGFLLSSGSLDDPGGCCRISSNGKLQAFCSKDALDGAGFLWISSDYGFSWKSSLPLIGSYDFDFSDDFRYVLRPSRGSTTGTTTNHLWVRKFI